jgi:hypothetical protein
MLQRGLDYAAGTVMICAVCAALLLLTAEILSFSSPVADAAAAIFGTAVLLNSLRRRLRTTAKHRSGPGTRIAPGDRPARIYADTSGQGDIHQGCQPGQRHRGPCLHSRSHQEGMTAGDRTLVRGACATRWDSQVVDKTPALPAHCRMRRARQLHPMALKRLFCDREPGDLILLLTPRDRSSALTKRAIPPSAALSSLRFSLPSAGHASFRSVTLGIRCAGG